MSESICLDKHEMVVDRDDYKDKVDALKRLVSLKQYKDRHGKDAVYEEAKPIVWRKAKLALGITE